MNTVDLNVQTDDERGRATWTAAYSPGQVIAGAKTQLEHHQGRLEYWREVLRLALEERKTTERIDVMSVTGGEQRMVRFDPGLDAKVHFAEQKVSHHRDRVRLFKRYILLVENVESFRTLELTIDDVALFFDEHEDDE